MESKNEPSRVGCMLRLKCPRCYQGDMFETGSWSFVRPFEMRNRCAQCNLDFWQEPGYYYGAMFISYGLIAIFSLVFVGIGLLLLDWTQRVVFTVLGLIIAINFVYTFRVARAIWIYINVRYDPGAAARHRGNAE